MQLLSRALKRVAFCAGTAGIALALAAAGVQPASATTVLAAHAVAATADGPPTESGSVPVGTGPVPSATFLNFPVSDRVSLQVNVGSGDALLTTSDMTLPGTTQAIQDAAAKYVDEQKTADNKVAALEKLLLPLARLVIGLTAILAHGVATHLHPMGVVNQPVEDAIGQRRIADLFVPSGHWQLRCENQRTDLIAVFTDLPEVAPFRFGQRCHDPIVDHENINPAQTCEQIAEASVGAGQAPQPDPG